MQSPKTSITLLNAIANDTESIRWTEFFNKYEPVMRSFLKNKYPAVDCDDIIQETLKALMRILPNYQHTTDKNGHFHAYLLGIVKHKAIDLIRKNNSLANLHYRAAEEEKASSDLIREDPKKEEEEYLTWKKRAAEAAIEQLLTNESINKRHKEIFRHVVLMHESPESVASSFGVTRGNVDIIKKRMIDKLSALVSAMTCDF